MLVKIGSVVVEIFSESADYCGIVSKVQISHTSISGDTGPQFTIFVQSVERSFCAIHLLIHIAIFNSVLKCQGAE